MRRAMLLLAVMTATLVVASGVAWAVNKIGTPGPDTLSGTNGNDNLLGLGGNDDLFSLSGNDNLLGGPGKDEIFGGNKRFETSGGKKNMVGGAGNDAIQGGKGSDNIVAEDGNDLMFDGFELNPKTDTINAGAGTDVVFAWNSPAGTRSPGTARRCRFTTAAASRTSSLSPYRRASSTACPKS
jgi:Ca2+-binding RTX toxin-like protein